MIYLQLFFVFARIGLFGFGGGMAMLPMIYQGAKTFNLMSTEEFSNLVAISQVTPGPIAVNAATYVGYHCAGTAGALAATLGVAFPSFMLVMLVCYFITRFRNSSIVEGAFAGIRPVTVGLIAAAVVFMAQGLENGIDFVSATLIAGTVILVGKVKVSPIPIVIGAGLIGAFLCG